MLPIGEGAPHEVEVDIPPLVFRAALHANRQVACRALHANRQVACNTLPEACCDWQGLLIE